MGSVTKINQPAPDFELPDLQGVVHRLKDMRGQVLILNFWSAECPWSERADRELGVLLAGWQERVKIWRIASNANETLGTIQATTAKQAPVILIDQEQAVADLYGALTTPHLYLIDQVGYLRYRGAIDDITFRKRTANRHYLRAAVEALLSGRQPELPETQPYGCTIVRHLPE